MSLERLLNHHDLKVVVVEQRYGGGFIAGVEIEDHPIIETVNDLNGESEWEFYGLHNSESWYPVSWGADIAVAVENLGKKIALWTKEDDTAVYTALNILRKIKQAPDYQVTMNPKTLPELREWVNGWDNSVNEDDSIVNK